MTNRWTLKLYGLKEEEKPLTDQNGWMSLGRLRSSYMDCNTKEEEGGGGKGGGGDISTKF